MMHKFVNQHPFLTFVFFTIILPALLGTAIGCGGDTACEDGSCGPGPTDDAGTAGDNNPITGKDGGTPDGGDATTSDAGSDAGKADCNKLRAEFPATCEVNGQADGCNLANTWTITVENKGNTCLTSFAGKECIPPPTEGESLPLEGADTGLNVTWKISVADHQVILERYSNGTLHNKTVCHF